MKAGIGTRLGIVAASLALAAAPALAIFSGTDVYLISVARVSGLLGSEWYTSVWVHNPTSSAAAVTISFLERNQPNPTPLSVPDTVPAGGTRYYPNIITDLFHVSRAGAIHITSTAKVVVTSRVYNLPSGGALKDTQGQDYSGIPASFAIGSGQATQLLGVYQTSPRSDSQFRYNFFFVETTGNPATVHVTAHNEDGSTAGSATYTLGGREAQYHTLDEVVPGVNTTNQRLEVSVTGGTGKILAVGADTANSSNDGTTFEMSFADSLLGGGLAAVAHDATLTGDGTSGNPLGLANGAVTKARLAASGGTVGQVLGTDGTGLIWQSAAGGGGGVPSVNGITGAVTVNGTGATTVSTAAGTITVNSPASLPPSGAAGGELAGTYPNPLLRMPIARSGAFGGAAISVSNSSGDGVDGSSTSNYGVAGTSSTGVGVYGYAGGTGNGVFGASNNGAGVTGTSSSGQGVHGNSESGPGVKGVSATGNGVQGESSGSYGTAGLIGAGLADHSTGVAGFGSGKGENAAGWFSGNVAVTGTLSKGGGSFKIDHPLDPEHKYLYHSFVESPDMMNIYNGNVTTDASGEAIIELPEWFEALNRDFRYQLTVIGGGDAWAQARVARKIVANSFVIQTSAPNIEVSWQVTGIRQDPFANQNRIPVEEEKPASEQGTYLHPTAYGEPEERGLDWARNPELMRELRDSSEGTSQTR